MAAKCGKAVVNIRLAGTTFDAQTSEARDTLVDLGSGFIVSQDGYILTAQHVIDTGKVRIESSDSILQLVRFVAITLNTETLQVELPEPYPSDLGLDIGILKASKRTILPYLEIAKVNGLELGEPVVVLGYPEVKELRGLTVTEGIISNLFYTKKEFRVSAEVTSGTSGSPVLNGEGKVIGIGTASSAQPDVVTFRGKRVICCRFFHRATNVALHRKEILTFIEQERNNSTRK